MNLRASVALFTGDHCFRKRVDDVTAAATCDNIVAVLVKPYARNDLQKTISAVTIQARRHTDVELNNLLLNMGDLEQ